MNNLIEKQKVIDTVETFFGPEKRGFIKELFGEKKDLGSILHDLQSLGLMLAGGAINSIFTDNRINDLDFYIKNVNDIPAATTFLARWFPSEPPFKSINALTFKRQSKHGRKIWTVQLITKFCGEPEYILDTFDYTITQGLYDFQNDEFVFGERFFQDLAKKRLTYLGKSHYPICALYRTNKYRDRGYKLPGSTIMHIALSIVRLEIKTYKDLKEQLMGIDTMYLKNLLNTEKYDDALPVDFGEFLADVFEQLNSYLDEDNEEVS
jgi:hypothetical protein